MVEMNLCIPIDTNDEFSSLVNTPIDRTSTQILRVFTTIRLVRQPSDS